jgi:hypothetical protein
MKRPLILLIAVATMTLGVITNSQEQTKYRFHVQLIVSGEESIKGLITSYINRELRSLRDVEIVYSNPGWELSIVAMELSTVSRRKIGVALSTVILKRFQNQALLESFISGKNKEIVTVLTDDLYSFEDHWLNVGSDDNLRKTCNEIVADFDADYLEGARKSIEKLYQE